MNSSASVEELKDALRENLDSSGALRKLKAQVRTSIYQAISSPVEAITKPEPSHDNLIINELIREYLVFNNYRETLSVFLPESGQPETRPFDRSFLTGYLDLHDGPNSKQLPLLYSLVAARSQKPYLQTAAQSGSNS